MLVVWHTWTTSRLGDRDHRWAIAAVPIVAMATAIALPVARRLMPTPGAVLAAIAASAVAVYLCVPETSDQMPTVAFVVMLLVAIECYDRKLLHAGLHGLAAAAVLWAGVYGSTGRQSALVGTLFAMWPVLLAPAVAAIVPRLARTSLWARSLVATIGAVASVVVARTGALQPTLDPALRWVALAGGSSIAMGVLVAVVSRASGTVPE